MRITPLFLWALLWVLPSLSTSAHPAERQDTAYAQIQAALQGQKAQQAALRTRLYQMNQKLERNLRRQDSLAQSLKIEARSFQERQAQTELALEAARQELARGLVAQEALKAKLQAELNAKFNRELLFAGGAFAVLLLLFLFLNAQSLKKGLRQNLQNWNAFQSHFLKQKSNE